MKKLLLFTATGLLLLSCKKELVENQNEKNELAKEASQVAGRTTGATQVSGISYLAASDECTAGQGATYAIRLEGDLTGCWYVFIEEYDCSPSGTYRESGREYFVGTYMGESGSFWTCYKFEGKYEGCAEDGSYVGAEIFGRCQHPIADGVVGEQRPKDTPCMYAFLVF